MFLPPFLGEDFEEQGLDLDGILKDIDYFIKPDPVEDPSVQPRASSSSRPPPVPPSPSPSPKAPQVTPRAEKKGNSIKALSKLKKVAVKKFGGGDQPPPELSDRLVPERKDGAKWYDAVFSKLQKPTTTRK